MAANTDCLYICGHTQFANVVILYSFFIRLYVLAIRLAGTWNAKAREWIHGRKDWQKRLAQAIGPNDRIIWMHCASAGELEQGKPLVEALKAGFPNHRILLSFFSPSGFAAGKKYGVADIFTYLPADTAVNARRFVELAHPELVIFVKYEYWHHHLSRVAEKNIPLLLVSAIFRQKQVFFRWYGGFFRKILGLFDQVFVQDTASAELLRQSGLKSIIAGDTRFDRVLRIAQQAAEVPYLPEFAGTAPLIVAGSTWPEDEELWASYMKDTPARLVLAPHEMDKNHLDTIRKKFPGAVFYSSLPNDGLGQVKVLVIDSFGLLSRLYQYATISYIGGGFNKSGIHNTLEAATYGKPVIFGPQYGKFKEARDLVAQGAAFSIDGAESLKIIADELLQDEQHCRAAGAAAKKYVEEGAGATGKITGYIQEKRLLTS
jgi:3-deoxy-D-manno-octulosonic-acid transferase